MLHDNLVFFIQAHHEPLIYIPHALQQTYLQFYYDHPLSGHLGFHKFLEKVRLQYYWPNMWHYVSTYIKQCALCQHIKPTGKPVGTLQPVTVTSPFELVGWDFMEPFPKPLGETSISQTSLNTSLDVLRPYFTLSNPLLTCSNTIPTVDLPLPMLPASSPMSPHAHLLAFVPSPCHKSHCFSQGV